jgi:LPS export ABC transporter protein LptC
LEPGTLLDEGANLNIVKVFTVIIAVSLAFLPACSPDKPRPKLPVGEKVEDIPNFVMEGFKLRSSDKGDVKWALDAKSAQVFELKKKSYAQNFTMRTFEKGGETSVLTGDRAVIDMNTNFLEATGNVRLTSSNGMVLITDKLNWDDQKKTAYGDGPVTVIKSDSVLKGIGFESDIYMRNLKIIKQVRLKAKNVKSD